MLESLRRSIALPYRAIGRAVWGLIAGCLLLPVSGAHASAGNHVVASRQATLRQLDFVCESEGHAGEIRRQIARVPPRSGTWYRGRNVSTFCVARVNTGASDVARQIVVLRDERSPLCQGPRCPMEVWIERRCGGWIHSPALPKSLGNPTAPILGSPVVFSSGEDGLPRLAFPIPSRLTLFGAIAGFGEEENEVSGSPRPTGLEDATSSGPESTPPAPAGPVSLEEFTRARNNTSDLGPVGMVSREEAARTGDTEDTWLETYRYSNFWGSYVPQSISGEADPIVLTPMAFTKVETSNGVIIFGDGHIVFDTANAFECFVQANSLGAQAPARTTRPPTRLYMNSFGGNVEAGYDFGRLLRTRGVSVSVGRAPSQDGGTSMKRGDCLSACAIAFLGGVERMLPAGSRLGFHAPFTPGAEQFESSLSGLAADFLLSLFAREMGVHPVVADLSSRASPQEVCSFHEDRLEYFNIVTTGQRERLAASDEPTLPLPIRCWSYVPQGRPES